MKEFVIGINEAGQRFDKYLVKLLKNAEKGLIFKQLRNKNIVLNSKKAKGNEILNQNDIVRIFMSDETLEKFIGKVEISPKKQFNLKVIYEDNDIILADKPAGVLSQKAKDSDVSMNEYLIDYMLSKGLSKESLITFKPAFCNRLDRNTSGLMIGGKSLKGLQKMSEVIKDRSVSKYYLAIVKGRVRDAKNIEGYLIKDEKNNTVKITDKAVPDADYIHTAYSPLATKDDMSILLVRLYTGKTHQIRAHLSSMGHPLLGDGKYGDQIFNRKYHESHQMLHSYKITFSNMTSDFEYLSGKNFCTDYPAGFSKYFKEDEAWQNQEV